MFYRWKCWNSVSIMSVGRSSYNVPVFCIMHMTCWFVEMWSVFSLGHTHFIWRQKILFGYFCEKVQRYERRPVQHESAQMQEKVNVQVGIGSIQGVLLRIWISPKTRKTINIFKCFFFYKIRRNNKYFMFSLNSMFWFIYFIIFEDYLR